MPLADLAERELPFLRRFARAATGSNQLGDHYVEKVLRSVLQKDLSVEFNKNQVSRVFLFQLLEREFTENLTVRRELARRALLLVAMEGFSPEDAAAILGTDLDEFEILLSEAEDELVEALATRMLIIEDEPLIAAHLKLIAEQMGHKVVGTAMRARDAVQLYGDEKPDIILADIQLADGSLGTEAVARMQLDETIPVVFITAYPERMLRDQNEGPTYLITKPFQPDYVKAVISHALIRANKRKTDIEMPVS